MQILLALLLSWISKRGRPFAGGPSLAHRSRRDASLRQVTNQEVSTLSEDRVDER